MSIMDTINCIKDSVLEFFNLKTTKPDTMLSPPSIVKGAGCWLQGNSLENKLVWSNTFSYYITDGGNMYEEAIQKLSRPLIVSFSIKDVNKIKQKITEFRNRISGVIWDYESLGTKDTTYTDLKTLNKFCKEQALPFGVVTYADPNDSIDQMNFDINKAKEYCDFVIPMLYCQWWGNNVADTQEYYYKTLNESNAPVVPVITLNATSEKIKVGLTVRDMEKNYSKLYLKNFIIWNVKSLTKEHIILLNRWLV